MVAQALAASQGPLPPETLRIIFRELMSGSRALQRTIQVACLGPKYSYSHLASVAKFGEAVEHVPVGSIAAVFEEVNRRHVEFGLVPLENSTDGRVADTLDMFIKLPNLKIRAEVRLRVHHCLLGRCEWSEVRRVYSKSQALSQCRNWLGKNLPQATKVEVVSTAAAAELAQREDFAAAVASRAAATAYRLNVLAENIEDQPHNVTRFAVIAERAEERTGRDKTTLMIRLSNQAGSLARTIAPFEKFGVNMTWIESFPIPGPIVKGDDSNPSYLFFIDVEGHVTDALGSAGPRGRAQALRAARHHRLVSRAAPASRRDFAARSGGFCSPRWRSMARPEKDRVQEEPLRGRRHRPVVGVVRERDDVSSARDSGRGPTACRPSVRASPASRTR